MFREPFLGAGRDLGPESLRSVLLERMKVFSLDAGSLTGTSKTVVTSALFERVMGRGLGVHLWLLSNEFSS